LQVKTTSAGVPRKEKTQKKNNFLAKTFVVSQKNCYFAELKQKTKDNYIN